MKSCVLLLSLMVLGALHAPAFAQALAQVSQACPTMEVSIVAGSATPSSRHVTGPDGTSIPLEGTPLLTIGDFTDANVSVTEGQTVLNVSMSPASAKRVHAFTAAHVGSRLAFLADGRVINTPKVLDPIVGKGFLIGPLGRDEAQKLSDSINHPGPGCPSRRHDST